MKRHDHDLSVERLRALAEAARRRPAADPARGGTAAAGPVRSMPAWVARFHVLPGAAREWWLLCEPTPAPGSTFPGQFVIDVPPGRYMVDTVDTTSGACVSRESAEGGRLVAGLTWTGNPILAHIYPSGA